MTIEEFIEARIAEDETTARAAIGQRGDEHAKWHVSGPHQAKGVESGGHLENIWEGEPQEWVDTLTVVYGEGSPSDEQADHIARHDPARVLRQCAAFRVALEWYRDDDYVVMAPTIKAIAAIWSDHPDYQQEWA